MRRSSQEQPAGLISVLLDRNAPFGDRDDAAMDLAAFDTPESEHALISVLTDIELDEDLAETVAESLGAIWARKRNADGAILRTLSGTPAQILKAVLDRQWPEWRTHTTF